MQVFFKVYVGDFAVFGVRLIALLLFFALGTILAAPAYADLTINSPDISNPVIPSASDYATEVLGDPWDMDKTSDLANHVAAADIGGFSSFAVQNGVVQGVVAQAGAYFYLLSTGYCSTNPIGKTGQQFPIDTTKYRYLVLRMFSDTNSQMRVLVNRSCDDFDNYWQSVAIPTTAGWKTYVVDMQTIAHQSSAGGDFAWNSQPATGLRIEPGLQPGMTVLVDWITLSSEAPAEQAAIQYSYQADASHQLFSLFLDDNDDPYDGVVRNILLASASNPALSVSSHALAPGDYRVIGVESNDWASLHGDAWDMDGPNDLGATGNIASESFTNGNYSGTVQNGSSYVYLHTFDSSINTSVFRYLTIEMTASQAGATGVAWFDLSGNFLGDAYIAVNAGYGVYTFDLADDVAWQGAAVGQFRITPHYTGGTSFSIHSISLRNDQFGGPSEDPSPTLSPGHLHVNAAPHVKILQPDNRGGEDFAQAQMANPWNMEDLADIMLTQNVTNPQIYPNNHLGGEQGSYYGATSIDGNYDPHQFSLTHTSSATVDTSRYKNLVFRMLTDRPQDIVNGSVVRIVWHVQGDGGLVYWNSNDIVTHDGWHEYVQDMRQIILEELEHPAGSYTNPTWRGNIDLFRVDPHEFSVATTFLFDYIRLTADDESDSRFAITYDLADSDSEDEDQTVSFYYRSSPGTSGGTLIGSAHASDNTRLMNWDTTGIPNGEYYLYVVVSDGYNSYARPASGRLVVDHTRLQNMSAPSLNVTNPPAGATLYDTFVAAGWALDDIQLAAVEVLVDGNFVGKIHPSKYNAGAVAAFSTLAESNNAGFFDTISLTGVSLGQHTMQFRATDTQGNETLSDPIPFTKGAGIDPSPLPSPDPFQDNPILVSAPAPSPRNDSLDLSVSLVKKTKTFSASISGGDFCGSLKLLGASSAAAVGSEATATVLWQGTGSAQVNLSAVKLKKLKDKKKQNTVFISASCDGQVITAVKSIKPNQLGGKIIKSNSRWINKLRSKIR